MYFLFAVASLWYVCLCGVLLGFVHMGACRLLIGCIHAGAWYESTHPLRPAEDAFCIDCGELQYGRVYIRVGWLDDVLKCDVLWDNQRD